MSVFDDKPDPFFDFVVHDIARSPGLTAGSAGYESGEWRNDALAEYLFEWLPEFALQYSDLEDLNSTTARKLLKKSATTVYTTEKYQRRGEFGELLLHAILREVFDSQPAISKLYFKTSTNETVKGFDAVHVVENGNNLELWLGEAKFHKDSSGAIRNVITELKDHTDADWIRKEFILIDSKINPRWKHADALRSLISERTSLDVIFDRVCVPVLLTYESQCVDSHEIVSDQFKVSLKMELEGIYKKFVANNLPPIRIHLFLIPLHKKDVLVEILQSKLEGQQR